MIAPNEIPSTLSSDSFAVNMRGIHKRYGGTKVLSGVDLTVPVGSFYVLVGPNGAGKSTTMKLLLDLIRADQGTAEVFGVDVREGARVRAAIGWMSERHDAHYRWMRAGHLIKWHAAYYPNWDAEYAERLRKTLEINPAKRLSTLSKGEVRRVQLLLALAHRPPLLMLDEPTDGLDPAARHTALGILAEHMADNDTTAFVSTHLVYEVDGLADHVAVLQDGRVTAQIRRDELEQRMRNYTMEVPEGWDIASAATTGLTIVRQSAPKRELRWMVWGDERAVVERLTAVGATVRDVTPVVMEEAAIALMMHTKGAST